jgi:hypothetical protein
VVDEVMHVLVENDPVHGVAVGQQRHDEVIPVRRRRKIPADVLFLFSTAITRHEFAEGLAVPEHDQRRRLARRDIEGR